MSIVFDEEDLLVMNPNDVREIHYTISGDCKEARVEAVPSARIEAKVIPGSTVCEGIIRITTGDEIPADSYVTVIVSGAGTTISRKISLDAAGLYVLENEVKTVEAEGGTIKLEFLANVEWKLIISEECRSWIHEPVGSRAPMYASASVIVDPNPGYIRRGTVIVQGVNDPVSIAYIIEQLPDEDALTEIHREALIALYHATNGDNWMNHTNWCSDKPVYEWYGVNHNLEGREDVIRSNQVVSLWLDHNNLVGSVPEELNVLFDYLTPGQFEFSLNGNGLYGKIPSSLLHHPRWGELGWGIVSQNPWFGPILDIDVYNLQIGDREVTDARTDETCSLHRLFAQNEYTLVYYLSATDGCLRPMDFTQARTNLHLDYHGKGLSTVYSVVGEKAEIKEWINLCVPANAPEDIRYITDIDPYSRTLGDIFIFDRQGNLVFHRMRDYAVEQSWYDRQVKDALYALLGEPEEHPLFEMEDFYTSEDYSRDGEIQLLQRAGRGKGIDLVFMGDAYVDKDMESDGVYEQDMRKGMEMLFSIEPYRSLRDRFNVYSIKVVSPNNLFLPETETRINWSEEVALEYASKIPEISKDRMMVCVLFGTPGFWRSQTTMYWDGSFVSFVSKGIDDVLIHEVGGHGIAKLLDEYVEPGNERSWLSEQEKSDMDWLWNQFGWGANVDWRNDPAEVRWHHFLEDERYIGENIGIYEGSYLYGFGAYRPTENSMMRYNDAPFNAPSREQIYKTVMALSEDATWTYDYEEFVLFDAINRSDVNYVMLRDRSDKTKSKGSEREMIHYPPILKKGSWRQDVH